MRWEVKLISTRVQSTVRHYYRPNAGDWHGSRGKTLIANGSNNSSALITGRYRNTDDFDVCVPVDYYYY